jgi:hypothetical protein
MASTQHIRNLILALASDSSSLWEQFRTIVHGLSILDAHDRLHVKGSQQQEQLARFLTGWTDANSARERPVTPFDIVLVAEFLKAVEQSAVLSDVRTVDLDTLGWSDQLRFGAIAVLAFDRHAEVVHLFDLYDSSLVEQVCKTVFEIYTKAVIAKLDKAYSNERSLVSLVAEILQRLLSDQRFAVQTMVSDVSENDTVGAAVMKLQRGMIAALARLALVESK